MGPLEQKQTVIFDILLKFLNNLEDETTLQFCNVMFCGINFK